MEKHHKSPNPKHYRIKVKGHIDKEWLVWFEGISIIHKGANTILTVAVIDQPALHGLITRIRDLNLTLLSIECIESASF